MATYIYETIDNGPTLRFEARQSMKDAALTKDPATGRPVRRVISGGYGLMGVSKAPEPAAQGGGSCCGGGCGCH